VLRLGSLVPLAVISADSRQIYRGFDIGTAKPTRQEQARVPHFGIDVVGPEERYSAAQWAESVPGWLETSLAMGREPVVVGGTGFYLRALFQPLFEAPELDPGRRRTLQEFLAGLSTEELRRWCRCLDPERAELGRVQLLRALETALLVGRRISDLFRERGRSPWVQARYLLVDPGPRLATLLAARLDEMLARGWLDEVRKLSLLVPGSAPAWTATGYGILRQVVAGELTLQEARSRVLLATRQYAKRQRTWFRHQLTGGAVTTLDPGTPGALDRALEWWHAEDC
jgi:tRNA dimethylallyltransferase